MIPVVTFNVGRSTRIFGSQRPSRRVAASDPLADDPSAAISRWYALAD